MKLEYLVRPVVVGVLLLTLISCSETLEPAIERTAQEIALIDALQAAPQGKKVRLIANFTAMADARSVNAIFASSSGNNRVIRSYNNFPLLAIEVSENAVPALRNAPGVVSLMPDVPEPPALDSSLPVINADDVHTLGWDGTGFTIAILDTGIDQDHPFFTGRIVSQACYSNHDPGNNEFSLCPGNATSSTAAGSADIDTAACNNEGNLCDHGSHVAGIAAGDGTGVIGAPAAGVAPGANIIAIQVFTRFNAAGDCSPNPAPCVLTYPADQIAGLDRVFDLRNTFTIVSANMSLGGGNNATACDADTRKVPIDTLLGEDIATVIAAGNNGFNAAVGAPGCISTAVTVGATTDADNLAGFTNRGTLLDLFAPGVNIDSAGSNGGFESKNGTSMAAPHVAGAWAVLRQVASTDTVPGILNILQTTGVDITYASGAGNVTTPRIDLLAAIQFTADPPVLTVDNATVTVDEGDTATNTGTFESEAPPVTFSASVGTVSDAGGGTWSWSFETSDGPAQSQTVTVTATDALGQETEITFELVVENVAPAVSIDGAQVTSINEGDDLLVSADFTDPGTLDTHTATVTCHSVGGPQTVPGVVNITSMSPVIAGTVTATCTYGDDSNPTFNVVVTVVDNDGGEGEDSFALTVANVDPTVTIDETGATTIGGIPTFIGQIGDPLTFDANVTDPGSDDLDLTWDWDDGTQSTAQYLVNPPGADPDPSPDVDPRDVNDTQSHTWTDACFYVIELTAEDDDGGMGADQANVVIAGDSGQARSKGYWQTEFRGQTKAFSSATLDCYLEIVGFMSAVFDEEVDASSSNKAANVLRPRGRNSMSELLDAQLLAAWLNFANGAFGWDELVDTDGDKIPDTAFSIAVIAAEAVRLDPFATDAQLEAQKNILEWINLMHE